MKAIIAIATIIAAATQACIIGINGLTMISIPMTIFLGLEVIDKVGSKSEERA